jgi:TonB family protein
MPYMDNTEAAGQLLLFGGLSRPPKGRWKAFVLSWGLQTQIVLLILSMHNLTPERVQQSKKYEVIRLLSPTEAEATERISVNLRRKVATLPQPGVDLRIQAKLVVAPPRVRAHQPQAEVKPPELHVAASVGLPEIPRRSAAPEQLVVTNTFLSPPHPVSIPPNAAPEVQIAGFTAKESIASHDAGREIIAAVNDSGFNSRGLLGHQSSLGVSGGGTVRASGFDQASSARQLRPELPTSGTGNGPEILSKPRPHYTEEALKAKIEGEVSLEVLFRANGRAQVLRVLQGLGHGLDEQAVQAAEQIKFKPAEHDGSAVDSTFVVYIIFELVS